MALGQFVVRSKLMPPQLGIHSIARPRLALGMSGGPVRKVTLVSAPAGYGKTVLLGQWYSNLLAKGCKVAWISLDEDDRDVITFLAHVVVVLSDAGLDLGPLTAAAHKGFPKINHRAAVNAIINAAHDCQDQIFLILDDYHRAFSPDVSTAVESLIEHMPAGMHLILSGRGHPGIRLTHLRMNGWLKEVLRADISFTHEEISEYFNRSPSAGDIDKIFRRSEGWPIALNILRMAADSRGTMFSDAILLPDHVANIQDYWGEQVLSGLPSDYVRVLTDISILQRVNGDVINALCGRQDGWALLEDFDRKDLFVVSLDHEKKWYQFHQLFRDYLSKKLTREGAAYVTDLHRRAALWFMSINHVSEAFYHAGALENTDLVVDFIDRLGGFNICLRNGALAMRVVSKLSVDMVQSNARLWMARIYSLLQSGRTLQAISEFEQLRQATHDFAMEIGDRRDDLLAAEGYMIHIIFNAYVGEFTPPALIVRRVEALSGLKDLPDYLPGSFKEMLCWNYYVAGEFRESITAGNDSLVLSLSDNPLFLLIFYNRICLNLARVELGEVEWAKADFQAVIAESEEMFGRQNNVTLMPKAALAQIYYYAQDLERAEKSLSDLVEYLFDGEIWYECFATVFMMAALLSVRRPAFQSVMERIERFVAGHSEKGYVWLVQMMQAFRLRYAAQQGKVRDVHVLGKDKFLQDVKSGALTRQDCRWRLWNMSMGGLIRSEVLLGNVASASSLLDQYSQSLLGSDHVIAQIELCLLQALVAQEKMDGRAAAEHLERALTMPVSSTYGQLFLDEAQLLAPTVARMISTAGQRLLAPEWALLQAMHAAAPSQPLSLNGLISPAAPISAPRKTCSLSDRETTVLRLIWNGMSSKEIGIHLQLSESTVKIYRKRLYAKLGVNSRSEAIAAGRRMEILKDTLLPQPFVPSRRVSVE